LVIVDAWLACFADDLFSLAERLLIVAMRSSTLDGHSTTMAGRVAKTDGRFSSVALCVVGDAVTFLGASALAISLAQPTVWGTLPAATSTRGTTNPAADG
jgi:hypothetical protein